MNAVVRSLLVFRAVTALVAGGIAAEARHRLALRRAVITARLARERAERWTGTGRHRASIHVKQRALVLLADLCDLAQAPPWPGSMPQRPDGTAWGEMRTFRSPGYVTAGRAA